MNGMRLNRSGLNMSRLNASLLNASGIGAMGCKGKATMEDKIRESMVLWYDLAKQGATNEGMAADPRIIDHSGNGHHATCYNFAWSGNSGIGGVIEDFTSNYYENFLNGRRGKGTVTYNKIHITQVNDNSLNIRFFELTGVVDGNKSYKIRVTGIGENKPLAFSGAFVSGSGIPSEILVLIDHDGEYTIPETDTSKIKNAGYRSEGWTGACDIIIEQLPPYPHALVSDGVDDYAQVTGLPILTKENGYTVVAKRKWLSDISNLQATKTFVEKGEATTSAFSSDFFVNQEGMLSLSFGIRNNVELYFNQDTLVQTSTSYNGSAINKGDYIDTDKLTIFANGQTAYKNNIVLYSLLLFDRDLTDEEIDWVRQNLMGDVSGDI